jgi:hypothetical protein
VKDASAARERHEPPAKTRRQLRQEAGFGCCICGHPFFEYHHIIPYPTSQTDNPADMMVLCPNHHHEATVGALTESEQRVWKAAPVNVARGHLDGLLTIADPVVAVEIGTNQFVGGGFKLVVDGAPLLQLERDSDGRLLLSLDAYGENDNLLFTLSQNEWITGDPLPWDFEFGYRWLTLRHKARKIALSIDARRTPVLIQADLWRHSQNFATQPHRLEFNGVVKEVSFSYLGLVGMMLVADTGGQKFTLEPDPALGRAMIVTEPDPIRRLVKGLDAYQQLLEAASRRGSVPTARPATRRRRQ